MVTVKYAQQSPGTGTVIVADGMPRGAVVAANSLGTFLHNSATMYNRAQPMQVTA
jgi:hypothetical protein